ICVTPFLKRLRTDATPRQRAVLKSRDSPPPVPRAYLPESLWRESLPIGTGVGCSHSSPALPSTVTVSSERPSTTADSCSHCQFAALRSVAPGHRLSVSAA